MSLVSRTFYVSAPAAEAYREWKSLIHVTNGGDLTESECALIHDVPGKELHWLSRWGIAHIDTRADFIPAQGGCVVHLNVSGIGKLSRFILSTVTPLSRGPWSDRTPAQPSEHLMHGPARDL